MLLWRKSKNLITKMAVRYERFFFPFSSTGDCFQVISQTGVLSSAANRKVNEKTKSELKHSEF